MSNIPDNHYEKPLNIWKNKYKKEWRWRFIKLSSSNMYVEISYMTNNYDHRIYLSKYGTWVLADVSNIHDKYVVKEYYCYE
jgi:hypothetical protein